MPRALSSVEHAFWLLDRATSFNGVNTSFLRGPIRAADIQRALEWVQARHELLRVAIAAEPPRFVRHDAGVPLRVVPRASADTWQSVELDEINRRFDERQLLWRAVWVEGDGEGELVISHQHVICDAQSAVIMAREIVHALGAIVDGRTPDPPIALSMRAPMTELLEPTLSIKERLISMNAFFFRNLVFHGLRPARKLAQTAPFHQRKLGIVHLLLDDAHTARLTQTCKAQHTTVQGAVCAALLLAASELLGLDGPEWLGCFSAVSLHERLGVRVDMGLYVSQVTTYHQVGRATDPWQLAREIKRDLVLSIERGEQLVSVPMMGMFIPRGRDPGPRFAERFDLASPATVGLSNIGRIDLPARVGPVELSRFHLAVGPSVVAPLAACAATLHGRLALNLVYVEPLLSRSKAAALAERTRAALEGVTQ